MTAPRRGESSRWKRRDQRGKNGRLKRMVKNSALAHLIDEVRGLGEGVVSVGRADLLSLGDAHEGILVRSAKVLLLM